MQVFPGNIKVNNNAGVDERKLSNANAVNTNSGISFEEVLGNKISEATPLVFSKHASLRLNSRNINLSHEQLSRVESGLSKARQKGINDSLVVVDDIRLVVNVKSKTVITAMQDEKDNNIFTNIDGAVIV